MEALMPKFAVGCVVENRYRPRKWIVVGHELTQNGFFRIKARGYAYDEPPRDRGIGLTALETSFTLACL